MKILIIVLTFICYSSFGQYIPSSVMETSYSGLQPISGHYNTGTDTRSAYAGSASYANYLNVTVSDYKNIGTGTPQFHWDSSHGTTGNYNLPEDALDPDVVLVKGINPLDVWAIVVYYSENDANPGTPGYYMSVAPFNPVAPYIFTGLSSPMLIFAYTPSGSAAFSPSINIDSDTEGNYAVVFQHDLGSVSETTTYTVGMPIPPANTLYHAGLFEADIALDNIMGPGSVKIIALNNNRDTYTLQTRNMAAVPMAAYTSGLMPTLYNPRIASAPISNGRSAITVMQEPGPGVYNVLFDMFSGVVPMGVGVVNNGSILGYPSPHNTIESMFPAVSYYILSGTEYISLAWHTEYIAGWPNQNNTFIGLDINATSLLPSSGNAYLDVSYVSTVVQNQSTIALSGRYTGWCKSSAFAYGLNASQPNRLVWKYGTTNANWKQGHESITENEVFDVNIYPNPADHIIHFTLNQFNDEQPAFIEVTDLLGRKVFGEAFNQEDNQIDISTWISGTYIFTITNGEHVVTRKITKQ